jgi:hypothetical protein
MAADLSANSDFINRDLSRSGLSVHYAENEDGFSTPQALPPSHDWIGAQLRVHLSENKNDTVLHKTMMARFYHKYSASQDYYFSNQITNILGENATPSVVRWHDLLTVLDQDEYFKRFYELHEYDNKINLLSEYYKFHKDIPRVFAVPASKALNRYHDEKRKMDYNRIKRMLIEEAAKKNKRVAMNDDDNEIRLTDGEIQESDHRRGNQDSQTSRSDQTSSVDIEAIKDCDVLPQRLIHSLYKNCGDAGAHQRSTEQVSGMTLIDLKERLGLACKNSKTDWSDMSSINLSRENWAEDQFFNGGMGDFEYKPDFPGNRPSNTAHNKSRLDVKPITLNIADDKARNIKDVNLNINLNLRVLRDQISSSSEYNCFFPHSKSYLKPHESRQTQNPSPDSKKLATSRKISPEGFPDFRKKARADELRVSSKDQTAESRLFKKSHHSKQKHLMDSENSLSQKRLLAMPQLPVAKLKIHTFSKLMKDMGGEYKKATVKTMKLRKSRHLENILVKYKPPQDRTPDIESARKDRSDRKGNYTSRTRIRSDRINQPRGTASSSRGLEILGLQKSSREKINFKKKKLSLQQTTQQNSKETSKQCLNMDAASLYQTNAIKQKKRTISKSIKGVDAIDLIKDKYNGSVSARTKLTTGENSMLQNIMSNLSTKPSKTKLSLSNSIANATSGQPKLFSLNVNSHPLLNKIEPKEIKRSKSKTKRDGRSKSVKSGGRIIQNKSGNLQGSKFSKLMQQQMKNKTESGEMNKRSFGDLLSYRGPRDFDKLNNLFEARDKTRSSNKALKLAGHTFNIDRIPTSHGYSKSEISQIPLVMALPSSQLVKLKASISASRIPSLNLPSKSMR